MQQRSSNNDVDLFIARHLNPSPGRTIKDIKERILHWIEVANNPSQFIPADTKDVADVRRKARQNVRRLVKRHPDAAAMIDNTAMIEVAR